MDSVFELEIRSDFLYLKHKSGWVIDPESTQRVWTEVGQLCIEHGRSKVLIEAEKPQRRLDTMAAFDSGRILAEINPGVSIAMCFKDYEFDELTTFFKTVAQNRGVRVGFFSNVEEACAWLGVEVGELVGRRKDQA